LRKKRTGESCERETHGRNRLERGSRTEKFLKKQSTRRIWEKSVARSPIGETKSVNFRTLGKRGKNSSKRKKERGWKEKMKKEKTI